MNAEGKPVACIVGTGFIGPAHLEALRRIGVEVAALVERDEKTALAKAAELGLPKGYGSYEEALADPRIDVMHLAVPNNLHAPYAKAALKAGKHVLCEKPLATSSAESAELVELARITGLVGAVNYNLRFYPLVQEARQLVRQGKLGRTFLIHGSYLQDWLLFDTDWTWRLDPATGGSLRAVADIGTHWLDMVSFVTGLAIEEVFADLPIFYDKRKRPTEPTTSFSSASTAGAAGNISSNSKSYEEIPITTEDAATILLRFEGGVRGSLTVSQVSAGRKNALEFEVDGSAASIAWNSEEPNSLWMGKRDEPNRLIMKDPALLSKEAARFASFPGGHQEGYPDTMKQMFSSFYSYLQAGMKAGNFDAPRDFPTFEDGHREMLLCEAILQSSKEGRWVRIQDRGQEKGGK